MSARTSCQFGRSESPRRSSTQSAVAEQCKVNMDGAVDDCRRFVVLSRSAVSRTVQLMIVSVYKNLGIFHWFHAPLCIIS